MENFIISLKNGEKYRLVTEYKRISVNNKMAIYYYFEVFSQIYRHDIVEIRKPNSDEELTECSLIIFIDKAMIKRFSKM